MPMLVFLLFVELLFATSAKAAEDLRLPKVTFYYSNFFDDDCSESTNYPINKRWQADAKNLIGSVAKEWELNEKALLGTVTKAVGKGFKQLEISATATVCKYLPQSHPLLLNFRNYIQSYSSTPPKPMSSLMATIQHELLHWYVEDHLPTDGTTIIRKYRKAPFREGSVVINHLHVLALQKFTYTSLNRLKELEPNIERDRADKSYRRAWEIVEAEGLQAFIDELK